MKVRTIKSLVAISLLLFFLFPENIYAQRKNKKEKYRTVKVKRHHEKRKHHKIRKHNNKYRTHKSLPANCMVFKHRKHKYHYHHGRYFIRKNGFYHHVMPPIGLRVRVLPHNCFRANINHTPYFYYEGVYYKKLRSKRGYVVVRPPVGLAFHFCF